MSRLQKLIKFAEATVEPMVKEASMIKNAGLKYHVENDIPLYDNIYRLGSPAFFELISEARNLYESGFMKLCEEDEELLNSDIGKVANFEGRKVLLDIPFLDESLDKMAKKKGKDPELGKPKRGGSKKFYVYTKCNGKVKKISFGSPDMPLRISEPERRKSFVARHKCKEANDRCTPRYWSCRIGRYPHLTGAKKKYTWW